MFFNRVGKPSTKGAQVAQSAIFAAPVRGWIRNESLIYSLGPGGAEVLENGFPTTEGARMRKGSLRKATIGDSVTHLATYKAGVTKKLFGFDEDAIYDVTTPADPVTPVVGAVGSAKLPAPFTTHAIASNARQTRPGSSRTEPVEPREPVHRLG